MGERVFTILAEGVDSCPALPVEFICGEKRAVRLCKSLGLRFPGGSFSHRPWTSDKLEEPPAFTQMASDAPSD